MIDAYKPFLQGQAQKCYLTKKFLCPIVKWSASIEVMHVLGKPLQGRQEPLVNGHQWLTPSHCNSG